jgi:SAM-dependent methyltransferase
MTATSAVSVDPSNEAQLCAWDGEEGAYWAAHPDYFDRSLAAYHDTLFDAAAIGDHDRVLDVGCGTGQTTREAARRAPSGTALGIDLSAAMLDVARRRAAAEGLVNISFEHADAQIHPFSTGAFDLVMSRTGASFFGDLDAAYANLGRALRPGGRLAVLTWQSLASNEWVREFFGALAAGRPVPAPPPGAPGPFSLADPDRVRAILDSARFTSIEIDGVSQGMWFGADAREAHDGVLGVLGWLLEGLDDETRTLALEALDATIAAHLTDDGVVFPSAAWIIQARRA